MKIPKIRSLKRVMGKAERRARRLGPRSEFIVMVEAAAIAEEKRRREIEIQRQAKLIERQRAAAA